MKSAARGLSDEDVIKLVADGIDKKLGDGTSRLLFKTFQLVYHYDVISLPSRLDYFETLVQQVIGKKPGQAVICEIISEIKIFKDRNIHK